MTEGSALIFVKRSMQKAPVASTASADASTWTVFTRRAPLRAALLAATTLCLVQAMVELRFNRLGYVGASYKDGDGVWSLTLQLHVVTVTRRIVNRYRFQLR